MPLTQPTTPVNPEVDEAKLSWVGGTAGNYVAEPDPWLYNIDPSANLWSEDSARRVTEVVRVENPDDSDQYVEIERVKESVFKKRSTGEEMRMGFDWDAKRK